MTSTRFIERAAARANAIPVWHETSFQIVHGPRCEQNQGRNKKAVRMVRVADGACAHDAEKDGGACAVDVERLGNRGKRQRLTVGREHGVKKGRKGARMTVRRRREEERDLQMLLATKNYEVNKIEAYSEVKYHVVMEGQRRKRIGDWADIANGLEANAILFVVLAYGLDRRLVSKKKEEREESWRRLENEYMWMFEALVKRLQTFDGMKNWGILTAKFGSRASEG